MKRKIETMRLLESPNGMDSTHYVTELTEVRKVERVDEKRLRVEFMGEISDTTIDFCDFNVEKRRVIEGATGVCVVDLREVEAIAVQYEGAKRWNRNYLSQITRRKKFNL